MTESNLRRNGEWYDDPTPYNAFSEVHEGEIYTVGDNEFLVVRVHDGFANVLMLVDNKPARNHIEVKSRSKKYTIPSMLSYLFTDRVGWGFVKKLPDDEFETVLREVEAALMLEIVRVVTKENIVEVEKEVEPNTEDCSIYKQLYEELLEKVMKKAFG